MTIGLSVVKQISLKDAAIYLVAEFAGGISAALIYRFIGGEALEGHS